MLGGNWLIQPSDAAAKRVDNTQYESSAEKAFAGLVRET
jgi:hypothetical protein